MGAPHTFGMTSVILATMTAGVVLSWGADARAQGSAAPPEPQSQTQSQTQSRTQSQTQSQPPLHHPMTTGDLSHLKGVSDPQISPDGRSVAYVRTTVDYQGDKTTAVIVIVDATSGA